MDPVTMDDCIRFHGHLCGGVALGYVMSRFAMEQIGAAPGEALYCRVEFQNCMTDAVQCVTGCTTGKGNLAIHPIGKRAMTLVRRDTGRGVRVTAAFSAPPGATPEESAALILAADAATLCRATEATLEVPPRPEKRFACCPKCGEEFDLACARQVGEQLFCPDCAPDAT